MSSFPPVHRECAWHCDIPEQQGEPVDFEHRWTMPQPTHKAWKALQIHRYMISITSTSWRHFIMCCLPYILFYPFSGFSSSPTSFPTTTLSLPNLTFSYLLRPPYRHSSTLHSMPPPFSLTPVTSVIMQKNGAGLHTASSCYWDNSTDGECV